MKYFYIATILKGGRGHTGMMPTNHVQYICFDAAEAAREKIDMESDDDDEEFVILTTESVFLGWKLNTDTK